MKREDIKLPEGWGSKLLKIGAGIALVILGKRALAKGAQSSADDQIDTDPSAGHARRLDAAMNPSGIQWMREFDTTNTTAIYEIAQQITNLDAVKKFYSAQTKGRVLHEDLIKELGAEGYDKFLTLATKGKSGSPKYSKTRTDIPANLWLVTLKESNIRTSPILQSKHIPGNNILKLVPKGKSIGITTGKYAYDEAGDVTFIEFFTLAVKTKEKKFFYVAKSQVEMLTVAEKQKREKAREIPFEFLAGTNDQPKEQVVSKYPTTIYTEDFKPLDTIPANIIIGFPILTLDTGKGVYTKVETIQKNIRWVKESDCRIQNRT